MICWSSLFASPWALQLDSTKHIRQQHPHTHKQRMTKASDFQRVIFSQPPTSTTQTSIHVLCWTKMGGKAWISRWNILLSIQQQKILETPKVTWCAWTANLVVVRDISYSTHFPSDRCMVHLGTLNKKQKKINGNVGKYTDPMDPMGLGSNTNPSILYDLLPTWCNP